MAGAARALEREWDNALDNGEEIVLQDANGEQKKRFAYDSDARADLAKRTKVSGKPNTKRTYDSQLNKLLALCQEKDVDMGKTFGRELGALAGVLFRQLAKEKVGFKTLEGVRSAIVKLDKSNRLTLPTATDEPAVSAVEEFVHEYELAKEICLGKKGSKLTRDPHAQTVNDAYDEDQIGRVFSLMASGTAVMQNLGWKSRQMAMLPLQQSVILQQFPVQQRGVAQLAQASQLMDLRGLTGAAGGSGVGGLALAGTPGLTPGGQQQLAQASQLMDLRGLTGAAGGGVGGLALAGTPGLKPGGQQQLAQASQLMDLRGLSGAAGGGGVGGLALAGAPGLTPGGQQQLAQASLAGLFGLMGGNEGFATSLWYNPPKPINTLHGMAGARSVGTTASASAVHRPVEGPAREPYSQPELQFLPPGKKPWPENMKTALDFYHIYYVGYGGYVPLAQLVRKYGDCWRPAWLKQRWHELCEVRNLCFQATSVIRRVSEEQAAVFWTEKQKLHGLNSLKALLKHVKDLRDSSQFELYVSKTRPASFISPAKADLVCAKAARLKAALERGSLQAKRRKIGDMGHGVETAAMAGGAATALEAVAGRGAGVETAAMAGGAATALEAAAGRGAGVETAAMAGGAATALEAVAGTIAVTDRGAAAKVTNPRAGKKNVDGQAAKPKQVPNGYMLFTQSQKAAAAAAGQSSLPHEHTKQIALKWRQLSQAERDYWNAQSKQLWEHQTEL